jgi:putative holliday junction resolvase
MVPLNPQAFTAALPLRGRLLALDVGDRTIGVAVSDTERRMASPLTLIKRGKFRQDAEALQRLVSENNAAGLVIGYPLNMDGSEGPRCQSTRQFVRNLEAYIALPMLLWDERQTSQMAEEVMAAGGAKNRQKSELVDKLAAAAILQSFLETTPRHV